MPFSLRDVIDLAMRLGPKLKSEWPYILHAYQDLQHVYLALNNGKPLMGAESPDNREVNELRKVLEEAGIDTPQADLLVQAHTNVAAGMKTVG